LSQRSLPPHAVAAEGKWLIIIARQPPSSHWISRLVNDLLTA
jgi:hypothetical protein